MEPRDESFILNYQKGQDCPQGAAALEEALFITLHSILLSRLGYLKVVWQSSLTDFITKSKVKNLHTLFLDDQ